MIHFYETRCIGTHIAAVWGSNSWFDRSGDVLSRNYKSLLLRLPTHAQCMHRLSADVYATP